MRALLPLAIALQCAAPQTQTIAVLGGYCAQPYELEATPKNIVVARGLAVGDCVELAEGVSARLCCPADVNFPRRCGSRAAPIPAQHCARVVTP